MKAFALPIGTALILLSGCDRSTAPDASSSGVAIAPRLLASSLRSQRVSVKLVDGQDTVASIDKPYVSGMHLVLGNIPVGDTFTIVGQGYDTLADGYWPRIWWATVTGVASGTTTTVQSVDVPVDTASIPVVDTTGSSLILPDGTYYTTDGADPRAQDTGNGVHLTSGATAIPKTGTVRAAVLTSTETPGVSVWSRVSTWSYSSTGTVASPAWVEGTWWEDDTDYTGERFVYKLTFYATGTYTWTNMDTIALTAGSGGDSGTWTAASDSTSITFISALDQANDDVIHLRSVGGVLHDSDEYGLAGILERNKPSPSVPGQDAAAMSSLSGVWWFDTSLVNSSSDTVPVVVEYAFRSDGSFSRTYFATPADSTVDTRTLTWSANSTKIVLTVNDSTLQYPYKATATTVSLLDGSKDSLTRARPAMGNSVLSGSWVYNSSNSITFGSTGACTWIYEGSDFQYTWSERNGNIYLYSGGTLEYVYTYTISGSSLFFDGATFVKS